MPRSVANYVHRIGRTARASAEGVALSFVTIKDEPFLKRLQKKRAEENREVKPYAFKLSAIEGFRYRVEDVLRSITNAETEAAR